MRKTVYALEKIEDQATVDTFKAMIEGQEQQLLSGFRGRFREISVTAGTHLWPHYLGFAPKDVIQTSLRSASGAACTWTWNYRLFDKDNISFTVTGTAGDPITVRAFIGKYEEA